MGARLERHDRLDPGQRLQRRARAVCPAVFRGEGTPPAGVINATLNPDIVGLKSRQWLDVFLTELDRRGIYILLDHHPPDCQAISELWYTPQYTEAQ